ncbi:MAG: hypothetical protein WAN93_00890 [Solirubrobacteraceae bacterium]
MEVEDLRSRRLGKWLIHLDGLQTAKDSLETQCQLDGALALLREMDYPRSEGEATALIDALDFAVDALCNLNRTAEAVQYADKIKQVVDDLTPNRPGLGRGPQWLPAFRAARILARAIELDGDPDEAMRRVMGLYLRLYKESPTVVPRVELLQMLRDVLSATKRENTPAARSFAALARLHGDRMVAQLQSSQPTVASSYMYRAALEQCAFGKSTNRDEVIALLERSLCLRSDTPRNSRSRGMAIGELLVQRGEREKGAAMLTSTAEGFRGLLPRHLQSARRQLMERDLWLAA